MESSTETVEGNNLNPRQDVGPHCNEQANGDTNLYLSPPTFISGRGQMGKEIDQMSIC